MDLIIEILMITAGCLGMVTAVCFLVSYFLFCYLELRDINKSFPFFGYTLEYLTAYEKPVAKKDEKIRRFRNKSLSIAGYSFMLCIIFLLANLILKS